MRQRLILFVFDVSTSCPHRSQLNLECLRVYENAKRVSLRIFRFPIYFSPIKSPIQKIYKKCPRVELQPTALAYCAYECPGLDPSRGAPLTQTCTPFTLPQPRASRPQTVSKQLKDGGSWAIHWLSKILELYGWYECFPREIFQDLVDASCPLTFGLFQDDFMCRGVNSLISFIWLNLNTVFFNFVLGLYVAMGQTWASFKLLSVFFPFLD